MFKRRGKDGKDKKKGEQAWCSWCFEQHPQTIIETNSWTRNVLKCTNSKCNKRNVPCKGPDCKAMARAAPEGGLFPIHQDLCAKCQGVIPNWEDKKSRQQVFGHCSWCFEDSKQLLFQKNTVTRSIYTCKFCNRSTLPCRKCTKGFARSHDDWDDELCAVCDGTVSAWGSSGAVTAVIRRWCSGCCSFTMQNIEQRNYLRADVFSCSNCKKKTMGCPECTVGNFVVDDDECCKACSTGKSWETLEKEFRRLHPSQSDEAQAKKIQETEKELTKNIIKVSETKTFHKDDILIEEGAEERKLILVVSGRVRVEKKMDRKVQMFSRLKEGDSVGEVTFLGGGPATATVRADEDIVKVAVIEAETLEKKLFSNKSKIPPDVFYRYLALRLSAKLRSTTASKSAAAPDSKKPDGPTITSRGTAAAAAAAAPPAVTVIATPPTSSPTTPASSTSPGTATAGKGAAATKNGADKTSSRAAAAAGGSSTSAVVLSSKLDGGSSVAAATKLATDKSEKFCREFNIPSGDTLIEEARCSLKLRGRRPLYGRCYVSNSFFCFSAVIFGRRTAYAFHWNRVSTMTDVGSNILELEPVLAEEEDDANDEEERTTIFGSKIAQFEFQFREEEDRDRILQCAERCKSNPAKYARTDLRSTCQLFEGEPRIFISQSEQAESTQAEAKKKKKAADGPSSVLGGKMSRLFRKKGKKSKGDSNKDGDDDERRGSMGDGGSDSDSDDDRRTKGMDALISGAKCLTFQEGDTIVYENSRELRLFQIGCGRVRVVKGTGSEAVVVAKLNEGTVVGEIAFLENSTASATIVADEDDVNVYVLEGEHVKRIIEKDPIAGGMLYRFLANLLAEKVRNAMKKKDD